MKTEIKQLGATDGHLRGVELKFASGLNCVIGARGTCKSTIVETLRFVFNDNPQRINELLDDKPEPEGPGHRGQIAATLRGGTAKLVLSRNDHELVVERDTTSRSPSVYKDEVVVVEEFEALKEVEIYSQGELQEIARDAARRLELVDRPRIAQISSWKSKISEISAQVAEIGPKLREISEAIEATEANLAEGRHLEETLESLRSNRPEITPELSKLRVEHQALQSQLGEAGRVVEGYEDQLLHLQELSSQLDLIAGDAQGLESSKKKQLESIAEKVRNASAAVSAALGDAAPPSELRELLDSASKSAERESGPYFEAMRAEEEANSRLKQEDRVVEEVQKLSRIRESRARYIEERDRLIRDRSRMRTELRRLREEIFSSRLAEVELLNSDNSETIVLSIRQGTQTEEYRRKLEELLDGSRIRDRGRLCRELAEAFPPDSLVDLVEQGDSSSLVEALERDPGQMVRLVAHLSNNPDLFNLESHVPEDELDVTMFVDGTAKSVNELSKGQRATAILPLVLRDAPYPLVLDQPEDDLDNRFIFETLVQKIQSLKARRQLIFVTHNANIPVIGDAERVLAMEMESPERAELTQAGDVEETRDLIIDLLEGGRNAFEIRRQTYEK